MRLRAKNITTIQYVLVYNDTPMISPFFPPDAIKNEVIEFLKRCPIDILQIMDSLGYLETYYRNLWSYGYDLSLFNISNYNYLKDHINNSIQVQLFFLDYSLQEHLILFEDLQKIKNKMRFFYFYNAKGLNQKNKKIVISPTHFIEKIITQQESILAFIGANNLEISPSVALEYKYFNEFYYFIPTATNYFLLNKIIGNFCSNKYDLTDEKVNEIHTQETKIAVKKQHLFDRQKLFTNQLNKIDYFLQVFFIEKILKPVNGSEAILAPLIMVVPFHNPDLKKIYQNKEIVDLLQVEQTENYIFEKKSNDNSQLIIAGIRFIKDRIQYLDNVSFLHSSITFSPIIRLPMKGKSIYKELSFFKPDTFPNISIAKNRRNIKKTIYAFGKTLVKNTLGHDIQQSLKRRNGQIVVISDLPVEWMLLDNVPLSFTHDICRLPETSLSGLMSLYVSNQTFEFSISKDIIKKTLVILGTDDQQFKHWQDLTLELSSNKGFISKRCHTLEEVRKVIDEIKPEFLIFDCHGGYDKKTRSSYLQIGKEILDGDYIVKHKLTAPIVFLSACGTAPTYGTINPIANAFFEVGAISVTSTFLPISIDSSSVLYLRILNNLEYASKKCIHKNWLAFICHLIRTSSISEAYTLALRKKSKTFSEEYFNSHVQSLTESLIFTKRRELFQNMDQKISKLTNDDRLYYSEVIPEYLMYSNLGRGDLILFDIWKEEYYKLNKI